MPSFGVYSDKGELYSSTIGHLETDQARHSAKVTSGPKMPRMQRESNIVVGIIAELNDNVAIIDLMPFETENFKFIPNTASAVLRVSNVRRAYVDSLRDEMGIGDMIRAKITEVNEHSVNLRTDEKDLGVIKAFCKQCRNPLDLDGKALKCGNCGHIEKRKLAEDYGSGRVI